MGAYLLILFLGKAKGVLMTRALGGTRFPPSSFSLENAPGPDEQNLSPPACECRLQPEPCTRDRENSRDTPGPIPGLEHRDTPWSALGQGSPFPLLGPALVQAFPKHFPLLSEPAFSSCSLLPLLLPAVVPAASGL